MASSDSVVVPLHLLLLPPVPWPSSRDTLKAAYAGPIAAVLKQLVSESRHTSVGARLDIALPVPFLQEHRDTKKRALFSIVQALIAGVYKLICVVAAKDQINVEDAEGIDVRVLMLAYSSGDDESPQASASAHDEEMVGPVIDLPTLAHAQRPWKQVFAVENEEGDKILRAFLVKQDNHVKIHKVAGGKPAGSSDPPKEPDVEETTEDGHHNSIAVGGTWDHIHIGHKLLLTMFAFMLPQPSTNPPPRTLTIGITNDALLTTKKYPHLLQTWSDRQHSVSSFLLAILDFRPPSSPAPIQKTLSDPGPNGHAIHLSITPTLVLKLVEIGDPFGPTITDEGISALVISAETRAGGKAVNEKRGGKGWAALEVLEVDVLDAEEGEGVVDEAFSNKLSSTQIRRSIGEKAKRRSKV